MEPRKFTARMIDQDTWVSIRHLHYRQGKSKSWLAKEFGISRNTVKKYLGEPEAPQYKTSKARDRPVFDKWEEHVRLILEDDRNAPRKQKHTARRVFDRLVAEQDFSGSERTVRAIVAEIKNKPAQNPSLPLQFEAGKDAQVDFGESYADIDGVRTKLNIFEMRLNYSRHKFVMAVRSPNMESFMEAHVQAFEFFGGVPERLTYDNLKLAVIKVGTGKDRTLTKKFKELKGFYNFETNFCTVGLEGAHEKGGVEGGIGYSRRNWMVPVPKVPTLDQLNDRLKQKCLQEFSRIVSGQSQSIAAALAVEAPLLLPLPERRFDPGTARSSVIPDGYQTVIYETNRYSVPAKFVGRPLRVRAYMERLVFSTNMAVVAEHERCFEREQYVLKAEHYLEQLERKPHAIPYAKPLLQLNWPAPYWNYFDGLVGRLGGSQGGREFLRIVRCHLQFGEKTTMFAIEHCASLGIFSADAVLQKVSQQRHDQAITVENLDLSSRPGLQQYAVLMQDTSQYQALL